MGYDLSVSFAGLDFSFWFQWSYSLDVDLNLNVDVLLTQIAKVTYSIGLISFVIEQVLGVAADVERVICEGHGSAETADAERGPVPRSAAGVEMQYSCQD